tara:strand:+ start:12308 stop:12547 length:240 start_codon:yes stop_codon:yes gene_type:complete
LEKQEIKVSKREVVKMFGNKIKLDADLLERCKQVAEKRGYSSVEEFIAHILEKELRGKETTSDEDEEEISKRLKGLGYL